MGTETAKKPIVAIPTTAVLAILTVFGLQKATHTGAESAVNDVTTTMREDMATIKANASSVDDNLKSVIETIKETNKKLDRTADSFEELLVKLTETRGDIRILESRMNRVEDDHNETKSNVDKLRDEMRNLRPREPPYQQENPD